MIQVAAGKLLVKKSKFYAHLYQLSSPRDIEIIMTDHKNKYSNANHHCYGLYYLDKSNMCVKDFQHDGEVGQPGKILLRLLEQHQLSQHALVVSRVFGGIKLGVGGVSRAFRKAGANTIALTK